MKKQGWKEYFLFTKKERTGTIIIVFVIIALMISPQFLFVDRELSPEKSGMIRQEAKNLLSERPYINTALPGKFSEESNYREIGEQTAIFYFDPNSLPAKDWLRLGLRERTVQTIENFRKKGGRFRKATDLSKIYGLRQEDVTRLLPYVRIEEKKFAQENYTENYSWKSKSKFFNHENKPSGRYPKDGNISGGTVPAKRRTEGYPGNSYPLMDSKQGSGIRTEPDNISYSRNTRHNRISIGNIDINQADSIQLDRLPGIGYKLANRIINFRNSLGGFYSVNQVRETFGISDSLFSIIKPFLICDTSSIIKFNINIVEYDQLQKHPYIKYQLAKAILNYRKEHGAYSTVEDLLNLNAIDEHWLAKVRPYLTTGGY